MRSAPRTPNLSPVPHPFLSDEWIAAAKQIREKYEGRAPKVPVPLRMNQVVTGVPFGTGTIHSHVDTTTGELVMDLGHLDGPDLTVTTDYATAREIFVGRDPQLGMQAFLSGRVKVVGDMTKLLAMQATVPDDEFARQVAEEIQAITS